MLAVWTPAISGEYYCENYLFGCGMAKLSRQEPNVTMSSMAGARVGQPAEDGDWGHLHKEPLSSLALGWKYSERDTFV